MKNNKGFGVVEIILILVIAIALVLIFRDSLVNAVARRCDYLIWKEVVGQAWI